MKVFKVTAQIEFVVVAESEFDALQVADSYAIDAARDSGLDADWAQEIAAADQLPAGWKESDLPYGGDGDQSIKAILDSAPPLVVRDAFTIDMFQVMQ